MSIGSYSQSYEFCGTPPLCYCNFDLGIVSCMNHDISILPEFNPYILEHTIFLDIIDTLMSNLTSLKLEEWFRVEYVTIRDNEFLPCQNILNFITNSNTSAYIDYTCMDMKRPLSIKPESHLEYLWLLSLLSLLVPVSAIIKKIMGLKTRTSDHDINPVNLELQGFEVEIECNEDQ